MQADLEKINSLIIEAAKKAQMETDNEPEPDFTKPIDWPITCTVGPGLEGAIASETKIGYVNGTKGWLIYRGYNIFDLCAYCSYEEVSYLLLHGKLPRASELSEYKKKLAQYRLLNKSLRLLMGFPVENMHAMAALRLGTNMMRQEFTIMDQEEGRRGPTEAIGSDEDSIPMETAPRGAESAIYEFRQPLMRRKARAKQQQETGYDLEACYRLIAGVATVTAAIARVRQGHVPIEPDPELSHAANFIYMMTGRRPSAVEERIMDIALILHADHGMNASTFASMVVASTLSDIYFSVGAGIAALNGPLHGGANEQVISLLQEIGEPSRVKTFLDNTLARKEKIVGFGHRVYKAYDPRARILGPLAEIAVRGNSAAEKLFSVARLLEQEVVARLGQTKLIFPNVDFYSGIVYRALDIQPEMFTPIFAVSRVAGWTARVHEYLQNNRIFRPRAMYTGAFNLEVLPLSQRT